MSQEEQSEEEFSHRLKMTIGNRSVRAFAQEAGMSEGMIRNYLSGRSEPTRKALIAISAAGRVSLEWLATGQHPAPPALDKEKLRTAEIPIVEFYPVSRGETTVALDRPIGRIFVEQQWLRSEFKASAGDVSLTYVTEPSLSPTLMIGDLVLLDGRYVRVPGDGIYAVDNDGRLEFRRIIRNQDSVVVSTDDPALASTTIPLRDIKGIVGRVVWLCRHL